jgi:hypothetical protein
MTYNVFTRTWWKENPDWPNGLEPCAGEKDYIAFGLSELEARAMCKELNRDIDPGRYSLKAEYEEG